MSMTPEERADRIISLMYTVSGVYGLECLDELRSRITEEINTALADAKAEERREWEEKLRLVHGG